MFVYQRVPIKIVMFHSNDMHTMLVHQRLSGCKSQHMSEAQCHRDKRWSLATAKPVFPMSSPPVMTNH